jgi:hypothetical protein
MRYLPAHRLPFLSVELATVHNGSDPNKARVALSVERTRMRHRALWYGPSWLNGRRFDAKLLIEEAAAASFARDVVNATRLSLRAPAAYTLRGNKFSRWQVGESGTRSGDPPERRTRASMLSRAIG